MGAENVFTDEVRFTVDNLTSQMKKGTVSWDCEEYIPASFMLGDKIDNENNHTIVHMGVFSCKIPSRIYKLEIYESIAVNKTCFGLIAPKLSVYDGNNNLLTIAEGSIEEENPVDEYGFLPLCDAIFELTNEWLKSNFFDYYGACLPFFQEKGITKKHKEHPMCRLMVVLMNERRVKDFHRMVLDRAFREQLSGQLL